MVSISSGCLLILCSTSALVTFCFHDIFRILLYMQSSNASIILIVSLASVQVPAPNRRSENTYLSFILRKIMGLMFVLPEF